MIIDGRLLAKKIFTEIKSEVVKMSKPPHLTVLTCEPNFETRKFLALKDRKAKEVGINIEVIDLPSTITIAGVADVIAKAVEITDGLIIQLPFPHLATTDLIALIPRSFDVDVMVYDGYLDEPLPPVVGAIHAISKENDVVWQDKNIVIVGDGRLVGQPMTKYAKMRGGRVSVVTKETDNLFLTNDADIVILGAGVPGLLTPSMVKDGVVVFDAGTSEEGGQLVGDADPLVANKASLFTPVPGGIGPLTVAILLKNVLYFRLKRGE